jgi:hypothetical protein
MAIHQPAPNLFNLEGDGATLSFETTSTAGPSEFSYKDSEYNVRRSGTDIRRLETEIGTLVTIDLAQIPHLPAIKVTLVLPTVKLPPNLPLPDQSSGLKTIAILTTSRTTIGEPPLIGGGQIETYRTLYLQGTARRVLF